MYSITVPARIRTFSRHGRNTVAKIASCCYGFISGCSERSTTNTAAVRLNCS